MEIYDMQQISEQKDSMSAKSASQVLFLSLKYTVILLIVFNN